MVLGDVAALVRHWRKFPPVHIGISRLFNLQKAIAGITESDAQESQQAPGSARVSEAQVKNFLALMGSK